ncbi:MAG: hypothetical protein ACK4N5_07750, partial [Myxococcales bacterium]
GPLPASGEFQVKQVPTGPIVLGLIAVVLDERGDAPQGADGGTPDAGTQPTDAGTQAADAGEEPDAGTGDDAGTGGGAEPFGGAGFREFINSASVVYDGKPQQNVTGVRAWATPVDFMRHLSRVMGLPADNDLEKQGFILGLVVDAAGNPVADVSIAADGAPPQVTYFTP